MRPLSPALRDAIRSGTAAPAVRLELIDAVPHYATVYAGGPGGRHAAALAPDGTLAQAYHDGLRTLYARRVPDPTATAWGAWSAVTASAAPGAGVTLARLPDRLRLLWQDAAVTAIYAADSFDGAATWTPPLALFDPAAPVSAIAFGDAGDAADGGPVFVAYQTAAGAWRLAAWTSSGGWHGSDWAGGSGGGGGARVDAAAIGGVSAVRNDDGSYLVAAAVQASAADGTSIQACAYDGTWSGAATVVPADVGIGRAIAEPRLARYDGRYHLAYGIIDAVIGTATGVPASRAALLHSSDGAHWSDPLEDAGVYAHGAVPLKHAAGYLLVAPEATALAPLYSASAAQYRDCSADITRLEVIQKDGDPARLVVTLQNGDAAQAGPYAGAGPLRPNAALRLSLGYGAAGTVPAYLFYIEDWSFVRTVDENEIVITASDALAWLDRQSRGALLYAGKSIDWLAREVAARAGIAAVSVQAATQFSYTLPLFSVPAGTTWRDALERVRRVYGFDVAARTSPDGSDMLVAGEKSPSDAAAWNYDGEVDELIVARSGDRANHVLVFGSAGAGTPPIGEAWDWPDVASTGQERYLHVVEPLIATRDGATLRAALDLQRETRRASSGSLATALHPGLEVWDVIAVATPAGTALLRVATLHHIYEPRTGSYDTVLTCEGV